MNFRNHTVRGKTITMHQGRSHLYLTLARLTVALAVLGLAFPKTTKAAVLVSNLDGDYDFDSRVGGKINHPSLYNRVAQAFTTGTNSEGYILNGLSIDIADIGNQNRFYVDLYSADDATPAFPDQMLARFSTQSASFSTPGVYSFSPTINDDTILESQTTYFAYLTTDSPDGNVEVDARVTATFADESSSDGWSIADGFYERITADHSSHDYLTDPAIRMSIDATPVPEPSTYALIFGIALGTVVFIRRHWAFKTAPHTRSRI